MSRRTESAADALLRVQRGAGNRATGRLLARRADPGARWAGTRLGVNDAGTDVRITSEVGDPHGYDDEWQARAVARMAEIDPAAVVQTSDHRWHAVAVSAAFDALASEANHSFAAVRSLPTAQGSGGTLEERASRVLGVPQAQIQANQRATDRRHDKVNLNPQYNATRYRGKHGRESHQDEGFEAGVPTAIELAQSQIDHPHQAAGTLFHEVTHKVDWDLAQAWVATYQRETNRLFVAGPAGARPFGDWLRKQAPKRLTKGEAELVLDITAGAGGSTEARAHVRTFIAQFEAGRTHPATKTLVNYATLLASGQEASPPGNHPLLAELTAELTALRKRLPAARVAAFDAALKAAKEAGPKTWLAGVR